MSEHSQIIKEVDDSYRWIDEQAAGLGLSCRACGGCCDFERFGHRLYVTTPELIYFQQFLGADIKPMTAGVCPYRIDGKCSVYPYRFSGCRIFQCKGDEEKQNAFSERVIRHFKTLCSECDIPYRYVYLQAGLEMLGAGNLLSGR
ncbi:MAG: hypothetical protein L0Y36_05035 [Planctomycetales bacterium]|nr:hypothetical protein [Planctomycetales bacterium]